MKIQKNRFLVILMFLCAGFVVFGTWKTFHAGQKMNAEQNGKVIYYCSMHPSYTSDRPGDCPICNMKLIKKEASSPETAHEGHAGMSEELPGMKVLTLKELLSMKQGEICLLHKCKMGTCEIAMTEEFARLGKCPHCGEDLNVLIKDFIQAEGYSEVHLEEGKARLLGIKTDMVKQMPLTKTIRTVGRIAHDPELYQAQEEYLQSLQALEKAKSGNIPELTDQAAKLVESTKIKLRLLGLSDELIHGIEEAGKPDQTLLYSEAGSSVWLYAPIYEYELPLVKVGDKVQVQSSTFPGTKFEGIIRAIDPVLNPETRTARVRAILPNAQGLLRSEMYVNVNLQADLGKVLVVPEEAVFRTGERDIIFVVKGEAFEPRQIVLGAKADQFYEIKSGVLEGEKVVTSGNFLIDSESRLKAALESAIGGENGGHQHGA